MRAYFFSVLRTFYFSLFQRHASSCALFCCLLSICVRDAQGRFIKGGKKASLLLLRQLVVACELFFFLLGVGGASPYDVLSFCSFFLCWRSFFHSFSCCVFLFSFFFFFFHYIVFHRLCVFMCVYMRERTPLCILFFSFFFFKYYLTLTHPTPGRIRLFFFFLC